MAPLYRRHKSPAARQSRSLAACSFVTALLAATVLGWASQSASAGAWCINPRNPRALQPRARTSLRVTELRGPNGKLIRCPGCGRAQRDDCDGTGKLTGGIGNLIKDFNLITAHSPCPRWKGTYNRRGKSIGDFFDPEGTIRESDQKLTVPATWRSLTRIRLREVADIKSDATGDALKPFEKFKVVDVIKRGSQHYLKLEGKNGWAFDRGIAGAWDGRPIAERIGEA